eukprot:TRINITY_DN21650_c0_g1_i1.p1 TRINITY_DN21650_c0_g1~~TRINITY_DN21650_c0_g1_i1.p1  ORF type:complete len:705 (+),score=331.19 TRINITY_DN21650_c0_g1_i1:687-2801(+)
MPRTSSRNDDMSSVSESNDRSTVVTYSEAIVDAKQFGDKTIGMLPGLALNLNNVTGPGMVQMPQVAATGGIIPTVLMVLVSWVLSSCSSTMMLESIKMMPGNSKFEQRIEFTTLAKHFFRGKLQWAYYLTLFIFMLSFQTTLIASVIESSQTTDSCFIEIFGKSCALQFHDNESIEVNGSTSFGFRCVDGGASTSDSPFGDNAYVISLGFVFVAALALPLGYWNLDDNIGVQVVACGLLCLIVMEWLIQSFAHGLVFDPTDEQTANEGYGGVPVAQSNLDDVFGIVLFNYAFVTTLPSWVNEKKVGVPINKTVWSATAVGTAMFILCGIICAAGYDFTGDSDLLSIFTNKNTMGVSVLTRIMSYTFPFAALVSGIPILSIIIRYNLLENNVCGTMWANFWGGVFPWIMSIALYTGSGLNTVTKWSGLLIIVPLNFVLPVYFYIRALQDSTEAVSVDGEAGHLLADDPKEGDVALQHAFSPGDDVDVWIPGHQWVHATVVYVNEQERISVDNVNESAGGFEKVVMYTVQPVDTKLDQRDVAAGNLRLRTVDPDTGSVRHQTGSVYEVEEETTEPQVKPQTAEQVLLDKLQLKLDGYEQRMADLRKEIKVFVMQFSGDEEQQHLKKLTQKEVVRLQRKVDRVIQKMEDIRALDGDGAETMLTSAQKDELFTALPSSWDLSTKIAIGWSIIIISCILNVFAFVYAFV